MTKRIDYQDGEAAARAQARGKAMNVTLLTKTGEQVELIGEIYPPFPKQFICRHEDGTVAHYHTWDLELLAVEEPSVPAASLANVAAGWGVR